MNYTVEGITDFLLSQTLECGQCFHYMKKDEEEYLLSAMGKVLHVAQRKDKLIFFDTEEKEFRDVWEEYFDLKRDYGAIKRILSENDDVLREAADAMWGVRILNQDFFETMISFIISQNQQIPGIKRIVASLSEKYGKDKGMMHLFPDAVALIKAGEEGIKACSAGFRAKYIMDACRKYSDGTINEAELRRMSYEECITVLKNVNGIGDKVANCIALFSLGKRNAFPIDVWIKRIMETLYFKEETQNSDIAAYAEKKFGEYGGYAQQYLFYYGKINKIGKK